MGRSISFISYKKIKKNKMNLIKLKYKIKNNDLLIFFFYKIKYLFKPKYYEIDFSIIENKKFNIFVDIGAYRGEYINFLLSRSKKILAFEPIKKNFNLLNKIFNTKKIFLYNYALGDKKDSVFINSPTYKHQKKTVTTALDQSSIVNKFKNQKSERVKIQKGDNFLSEFDKIDFIKIDVEGYEFEVLKGLKKTIIKNKPIFLIEIEKRHSKKFLKVFKFLKKYSYKAYYVNRLYKLKKIDLNNLKVFFEKNQLTDHLKKESYIKDYSTFNRDKKYICNFWFINKFEKKNE